jgi:hypothetical protein
MEMTVMGVGGRLNVGGKGSLVEILAAAATSCLLR